MAAWHAEWFAHDREGSWIANSGMTGLTLPGIAEEPGWTAGSRSSPRPASGPELSSRRSCATFTSPRAKRSSCSGHPATVSSRFWAASKRSAAWRYPGSAVATRRAWITPSKYAGGTSAPGRTSSAAKVDRVEACHALVDAVRAAA